MLLTPGAGAQPLAPPFPAGPGRRRPEKEVPINDRIPGGSGDPDRCRALTAAAIAFATIPGSDGKIHACYGDATGDLRVIDDATETCRPNETAVSWSQSGIVAYEVVRVTESAPPGANVVARARCSAGKKVLGGRYHTNNVRVIQNFPQLTGLFAPSCQVFVVNDTGLDGDFTTYAVCAVASP